MIEEGETILLLGNRRLTIRVKKGMVCMGNGTADTSKIIGKNFGNSVKFWGEEFRIYRASRTDLVYSMKRRAQVILPKDAAHILYLCDVRSGDIVLEAGSGSGWLTSSLALAVMPHGKVISYDLSKKSLAIARKNIENAGLMDYVEFREGDVKSADIGEKISSCVLDIPDPWHALQNIKKFLIPGGHICAYVPTYNQVEETVLGMRDDFFDIKAMEVILRNIDVKKGATRPEFTGFLHTGFIVHGRKI